ncbi:MAG: proton-coupled thiamine transporter YuaJ [Clostridiales bacterium]|jgi:thiamine transporter|nr:proton-coupled thiamine transporter YuaJ [Clostridiales bacterium]
MKNREKIITLCEGAICVALALVLSYIELSFLPNGGSVELVMIPIIIFAVYRAGAIWGVAAGVITGTLKFFLANGFAITWTSIIMDYSLAYGVVGLAGLFINKKNGYVWGTLLGGFLRFVVHFISGITIYAISGLSEVLWWSTSSVWIFSFIYNISYMSINTLIAVIISPLLGKALARVRKSGLRI